MDNFTPIELDGSGNVLPTKNDLIALIDADTIAFAAASTCEVMMDILPREFYTDEEWNEIESDPDYDDVNGVIYSMDLDVAFARCEEKINSILERTGCQTYELHFTGGRENFRYKVDAEYKGNRKAMHVPAQLRELQDMLIKELGGTMNSLWEADDIVCCLWHESPEKYLMCAVDKDVLYSVPKAFNYYESKRYNIDMKFIETTELEMRRHPYVQTLMGDTNDGIKGIYKTGKVKANKVLDLAVSQSEEDLWSAVLDAYEVAGMSEFEAIANMQLVRMDQLVRDDEGEWKVKLWLPEFEDLG